MGRRVQGVSQYKGRYFRTLGKVVQGGRLVPRKFLLGTQQAAAELASRRLEQLWAEIVRDHERAVAMEQQMIAVTGAQFGGDQNRLTGEVQVEASGFLARGPVWTAETLAIAEAIRHGRHEIAVRPRADRPDAVEYLQRVDTLRRTYSVIAFVPVAVNAYTAGQEAVRQEAQEGVQEARSVAVEAARLTGGPMAAVVAGQTLFQALDAYRAFAPQHNRKEFGFREAAAAQRLKESHADIPLDQFGISSLERIAAYWKSRPKAKKTGKPIALNTIRNHLKTARRFVRWLHRTDQFTWTKPVDAEDALKVDVERLRTDDEIADLGRGVEIWSIDELVTLYRYGTDQDRLLLLLGMNCGFAQAEICTLRHDEVKTAHKPPVIQRIRRKNRVPGVFTLWPETIKAIDWFTRQRPAPSELVRYVMITEAGKVFDRQRIANGWAKLMARIRRDHPAFRGLPFKFLRKTAGQLVRERSDGEISGVFLCHGRAVRTDDLADVYTNRPFNKVGAALEQVRRDLQVVFDAVPDPFIAPRKRGGSNISRGQIDHIKGLHEQGVRPDEIAGVVGVSRVTVYRHIKNDAATVGV